MAEKQGKTRAKLMGHFNGNYKQTIYGFGLPLQRRTGLLLLRGGRADAGIQTLSFLIMIPVLLPLIIDFFYELGVQLLFIHIFRM